MATNTAIAKPLALKNGVTPASRRPNTFKFREKPKNIATIDFGTTHCSVAYKLYSNIVTADRPEILKLDESRSIYDSRVPSCIVFDSDGKRLYFGYQARNQYYRMDHSQRPNCIYFEHTKMQLQHDKNVGRNQRVEALNGKEYFLIDVIAHILCFLKERLLCVVREFGLDYDATDFDWVVTVPAIWKAKGKQMMREAGYKAGLCSVKTPSDLKEADDIGFAPPPEDEQSPDKLSLALEPESAALYCQQEAEEAKKGADSSRFVPRSEHYLLLDIGGGTVDIATHSMVAGGIEELVPPTGNDCGGTQVNKKYQTFLGNFINDPSFSKYLDTENEQDQVRHKAELTNLIYTEFESQKLLFGTSQTCTQSFKIDFPHTFWMTYNQEILAGGRRGDRGVQIEDNGAVMRIMPEKMAEFFEPVITGITDLIKLHISKHNLKDTIETVYLVGGFGGCRYMQKQLETTLKQILTTLETSVPLKPDLATVYGATMFRCNPDIVKQRRADASYGLGCAIKFNETIHRRDYKYWNEDIQAHYCKNLFRTFVEKGDFICTNEVFVAEYTPGKKDQKSMTFTMYSAHRKDISYTTERGVYKLGSITVDVDGYGLDREVELVLDITHTELQLMARDKANPNNECKIVVDFLSCEREIMS